MHVLGVRRPSDLLVRDEIDELAYDELVRRRADRVPLQHLTGRAAFRYLELQVGPGVFVPRPETEVVVQAVVDELGSPDTSAARCEQTDSAPADLPPRPSHESQLAAGLSGAQRRALVVDLCSGSGAIALSVAHEAGGVQVHAVELDPSALEWAQRNDPDGTVSWHLGPVEGCLPELEGQVDVVVSNPPYVAEGEAHVPEPEVVDHDPHVALFAGDDGLAVIRQVERAARRLLKPGGLVVVEHSDRQGETAPQVFRDWADVQDHEDLAGRPRFVTARWNRP